MRWYPQVGSSDAIVMISVTRCAPMGGRPGWRSRCVPLMECRVGVHSAALIEIADAGNAPHMPGSTGARQATSPLFFS